MTAGVHARSALFDLYGDHLRPRGGRAPVAALVRLLAPLNVAPPAVRTAVSRMVRQGWLHPLRLSTGPGYLLTAKAVRRLDESAQRIYRTARQPWDGSFDLVVGDPPPDRAARTRLGATMAFLGYGRLSDTTWVAPRPSTELAAVLGEHRLAYQRLTATHTGGPTGAADLVRRAWDLDEIGRAYRRFVAEAAGLVRPAPGGDPDRAAYAARFELVHRWRTFLFHDPQLPEELLPAGWPGTAAAAFFDEHADRLRPAADRYVDACLEACSRPATRGTAAFDPAGSSVPTLSPDPPYPSRQPAGTP